MSRTYVAYAYSKSRRVFITAACPTRDEAIAAGFAGAPRADRVVSGYGYNGGFDILSITRHQWEAERTTDHYKAKWEQDRG